MTWIFFLASTFSRLSEIISNLEKKKKSLTGRNNWISPSIKRTRIRVYTYIYSGACCLGGRVRQCAKADRRSNDLHERAEEEEEEEEEKEEEEEEEEDKLRRLRGRMGRDPPCRGRGRDRKEEERSARFICPNFDWRPMPCPLPRNAFRIRGLPRNMFCKGVGGFCFDRLNQSPRFVIVFGGRSCAVSR